MKKCSCWESNFSLLGQLSSPKPTGLLQFLDELVVVIHRYKKIYPRLLPSTAFAVAPPVVEKVTMNCIRKITYIAFGTRAVLPPNEMIALAEALEASGTPFLWSMKDDDLKKHLPSGFLDRTSEFGKIVAWAPQVQVLSHAATGVFITHSGWGSVMESIAAGVPLICRPFFGDHSINTWMIENVYKIGVRVDGGVFTKNGAIDALKQVLLKEKWKMFRKQSTGYKELEIRAVRPDGSSTENF